MQITFSPFAPLPGKSAKLSVVKAGDKLTINGAEFDFSLLGEGEVIPTEATDCPWFETPGVIRRVSGQIHLTLRLPYTPGDGHFSPEPLHVTEDGPIELPKEEVTQ